MPRRIGSAPAAFDDSPFVGRERELELLRRKLDGACRAAGSFVLIAGEAGIGKTRLAEQIAREASERGVLPLVGRCYEGEGAPAYWPWVMVLRDLAAHAGSPRVRAWLGGNAAVVARVAPEVVGAPAVVSMPDAGESVRFRFFDAVAGLLALAAEEQPLVVFIDDLHWADGASLRLLHFAARQLARARILFVGTHREVEMRQGADAGIRAIGAAHPSLADLLSRTIRTGTFCSYDPMAEVPVRWTVTDGP